LRFDEPGNRNTVSDLQRDNIAVPTPASLHRQALQLAGLGRHEEALAALREHLLGHPQDGEALNDAGALLYGLGRYQESARHLEMALAQLAQQPAQTLSNLLEAYLAAGRAGDAAALLPAMAKAGAISIEHVARTAAALTDAGRPDEAAEMILRRPCLLPSDGPDGPLGGPEGLAGLTEQVRGGRAKVGLVCPSGGGGNWDSALLGFLGQRFHTRLLAGGRIDGLAGLLDECRIVWFEGCTRQVIVAGKRPSAERRTIVHLPPADAFGPCLEMVDWCNIDLLVTSGGRGAEDFLARRLPGMARTGRIVAMPRGLDLAALGELPHRPARRGSHLACVDGLSLHGNAVLLLQCLRRLHEADGEYRLSFAGLFADELLETRVTGLVSELGLSGTVAFDGWQDDLPTWLADKDYIVSAGMVEADPVAVPLALAMGVKPVLHVAGGGGGTYPPELLYRSEEEFRDRIASEAFPPAACRRLAEETFPLPAALARANELVVMMEKDLRDTRDVRRA
jgi:hypothetical protein